MNINAKKILRISVMSFSGMLITSSLSAFFSYIFFKLSSLPSGGGFLSLSSNATSFAGAFFIAILGGVTGLIIGFIVSIAELRPFLAALIGLIVGLTISIWVFSDVSINDRNEYIERMIILAAIAVIPFSLVGALTGFLLSRHSGIVLKMVNK